MSELAELESINPTMLSRITTHLAEKGLLERAVDPLDRRAATVAATAAGRRLRDRIHRERTEAIAEHLGQLDSDQRELLWRALPVLEELAERLGETRP
jgi:DNA-binding MarR family transcriptional regulator